MGPGLYPPSNYYNIRGPGAAVECHELTIASIIAPPWRVCNALGTGLFVHPMRRLP